MTIYELARELGQEILKTPQIERVLAAKEAYEKDEKAVSLINDFNESQKSYQEKLQDPSLTKEDYQTLKEELMKKSEVIQSYPQTAELIEAENDFNNFLSMIFSIVTATISGEDPEDGLANLGCGGNCGSCGGCH